MLNLAGRETEGFWEKNYLIDLGAGSAPQNAGKPQNVGFCFFWNCIYNNRDKLFCAY